MDTGGGGRADSGALLTVGEGVGPSVDTRDVAAFAVEACARPERSRSRTLKSPEATSTCAWRALAFCCLLEGGGAKIGFGGRLAMGVIRSGSAERGVLVLADLADLGAAATGFCSMTSAFRVGRTTTGGVGTGAGGSGLRV